MQMQVFQHEHLSGRQFINPEPSDRIRSDRNDTDEDAVEMQRDALCPCLSFAEGVFLENVDNRKDFKDGSYHSHIERIL